MSTVHAYLKQEETVVDAMSQFEITEKPKVTPRSRNGRYDTLLKALQNLASDRSVKLPLSYLEGKKLSILRSYLNMRSRKAGFHVGATEKDGSLYFWRS